MKLMLQCGDKFEIDVHYSLFMKGGLVSLSGVGNSPAKAHVDPTVDLDSFLRSTVSAILRSLPWRESVSRGSGEYDQQEFAPPFVSELHGGGPRSELLAMVLVKPKKTSPGGFLSTWFHELAVLLWVTTRRRRRAGEVSRLADPCDKVV